MEKYYYKVEGNICIEDCPIKPDVKIGSMNCESCKHYLTGSSTIVDDKGFIICRKLNENKNRSDSEGK